MNNIPRNHILNIYYQQCDEVLENIILCQRERVSKWMSDPLLAKVHEDSGARDKVNNPMTTLTGVPGCGKSTVLAHFIFSP